MSVKSVATILAVLGKTYDLSITTHEGCWGYAVWVVATYITAFCQSWRGVLKRHCLLDTILAGAYLDLRRFLFITRDTQRAPPLLSHDMYYKAYEKHNYWCMIHWLSVISQLYGQMYDQHNVWYISHHTYCPVTIIPRSTYSGKFSRVRIFPGYEIL